MALAATVKLVSEPLRDPNFRVEYARSNVDVHLNVMRKGHDGKLHPLSPSANFRPIADYESALIKEAHKWSPTKQLGSGGEILCDGESWRLRVKLTLRDIESALVRNDPMRAVGYGVPVVIAVTIEDPLRIVRVNDEMVLKWRARGFVTEEVMVQPAIRNRFGHL